jgi:hypothetical protein
MTLVNSSIDTSNTGKYITKKALKTLYEVHKTDKTEIQDLHLVVHIPYKVLCIIV